MENVKIIYLIEGPVRAKKFRHKKWMVFIVSYLRSYIRLYICTQFFSIMIDILSVNLCNLCIGVFSDQSVYICNDTLSKVLGSNIIIYAKFLKNTCFREIIYVSYLSVCCVPLCSHVNKNIIFVMSYRLMNNGIFINMYLDI